MNTVIETIVQSLKVENVEFNTQFPQVTISFSLAHHGAVERLNMAVGYTSTGRDYYDGDFEEIDAVELFAENPLLHNLSYVDAQVLADRLDAKLDEAYQVVASSIEAALNLQRPTLLANF